MFFPHPLFYPPSPHPFFSHNSIWPLHSIFQGGKIQSILYDGFFHSSQGANSHSNPIQVTREGKEAAFPFPHSRPPNDFLSSSSFYFLPSGGFVPRQNHISFPQPPVSCGLVIPSFQPKPKTKCFRGHWPKTN